MDGPGDVFRLVAVVAGLIGTEVQTGEPHEPFRTEVAGFVGTHVQVRPAAEETGFMVDQALFDPDVDL